MKLFLNPNIIVESYHSDNQSNKIQLDEIDAISDSIQSNINKEISIPNDVFDSFKLKKSLNTDIWQNDVINHKVRTNLYLIAKDFFNELKLPENVQIKDIIFTGSLANFNWSKFSDIDLHIVLDFKQFDGDKDMIQDFFDAKKNLWNQEHDIHISNFPVEIYVQDVNAKLTATAIYSILNNKWILKPKYENFKIDKTAVKSKTDYFINQLKSIRTDYKDDDYQSVIDKSKKLKDKIKQFRKAGLEAGGEFSLENIVFKTLRRTPFLDQLDSFKAKAYDKSMSIDETINEVSMFRKLTQPDAVKYFYHGNGFFDFKNAADFAKKYLKVNIVKLIGAGGNGAAYMTDKGKKIKFTLSENEYTFAKRSIGKPSAFRPEFYSADEVSDGIYVIEMEYLKPLPEKDKIALAKLFDDIIKKNPNYDVNLKNKVDNIKSKVGLYANDLLNADNYGLKNGELATFDPVSEHKINEDKLMKNGIVFIKGNPLDDGNRRLYATYVKFTAFHNRNKTDSTDAKPVTMVTLNDKTLIYRIKIDGGKLIIGGVDFPNMESKEKALGLKTNSVGLNFNKTPLHDESLKFDDVARAVSSLRGQIVAIPNIRWVG